MRARGALLGAVVAVALGLAGGGAADPLDLDAGEIRRILRHGPWPPPPARDPTNRVSGDPRAVVLGQRLFFDPRLSASGAIACATCHVPERAWTDGKPRAVGLDRLDRNTPTVLDARLHRWFSWDGRSDSLWAQSVKPILEPREMGGSARRVAALLASDPTLACLYRAVHGAPPGAAGAERALVNAGKAIAAFLETIGSDRTPFDDFRDALARGDTVAAARYPSAARRGLGIFVGRGRCSVCHVGPHFTNGEFHDVGVPFTVAPGRVDPGRHEGIRRLRADRLNLLGPYNDDPAGPAALKTRHVESQHADFGRFRTPSLRSVALTAPYMHDGRLATLRDVVRHYSTLDMERIHTHGEQLLRPLNLSEREIDDVVAFLETLSDPRAASPPPAGDAGDCARR